MFITIMTAAYSAVLLGGLTLDKFVAVDAVQSAIEQIRLRKLSLATSLVSG